MNNSSHTAQEKIDLYAISFLFKSLPNIIVNLLIMPTVVMVFMWGHVNKAILISWFTCSIVLMVVRYFLATTYNKHTHDHQQAIKFANYYVASTWVSGTLWGSSILLFMVPDSLGLQLLLITIITSTTVGSIIIYAYWLPCFYGFAIPALLLTAIGIFLLPDIAYKGLGVLILMSLSITIQLAKKSNKSTIEAIRLRFENLDLIDQLQKEKSIAEKANAAKSKFLASASHDLRQPVHALNLFTGCLEAELQSHKGKEILTDMNRSLTSLDQLLESLLDISKLEAGVVNINMGTVVIADLINNIKKEFNLSAKNKNLILKTHTCHAVALTDRTLLSRILHNLVSNAIRYTESGKILISCRKFNKTIRLEVWDQGIGIPADESENIFQEFHQLHNPERDRTQGLGLGLAICRRLAVLLKGKLSFKSVEGEGSVFRIDIAASNSQAVSIPQTVSDNSIKDNLAGKNVFIIDDDIGIRHAMKNLFQQWRCNIEISQSKQDTVERIKTLTSAPDIIISDYRLPGKTTGVDVIKCIHEHYNNFNIPAILITGDTAAQRIKEAQKSGYILLHKPVKPGQLRMVLNKLLS
jgi:signal transduction histidine kinase/CheY-like chemotaxis protein